MQRDEIGMHEWGHNEEEAPTGRGEQMVTSKSQAARSDDGNTARIEGHTLIHYDNAIRATNTRIVEK
jgi:hypothetical protein